MTTLRMEIVQGDITVQEVDAVVNAANESLLGGGGVDGAIHRAAGPGLLAECKQLRGCPTGQARITSGHRMPARFVIHAVGPIWHGGGAGEPQLLASCHEAAMRLAVENHCQTIAFPAISCGAYGYPWDAAARTSLQTVAAFLQGNETIKLVRWVLFGPEIFDTWQRTAKTM
jgi:O-acetyl-ADP-ribose deacetylase